MINLLTFVVAARKSYYIHWNVTVIRTFNSSCIVLTFA